MFAKRRNTCIKSTRIPRSQRLLKVRWYKIAENLGFVENTESTEPAVRGCSGINLHKNACDCVLLY